MGGSEKDAVEGLGVGGERGGEGGDAEKCSFKDGERCDMAREAPHPVSDHGAVDEELLVCGG